MASKHGEFPGNTYSSFVDLIKLERIDDRTYRSTAPPFSPGGAVGLGRAYGGHVFMQAAWAACQTVAKGFLLHNVTGNFLLGGLLNVPYVYKVHTIRDGRSYCTRIVNVTQAEGKGICFTCTCSFKTPESGLLDVQDKVDIWNKYIAVLDGKKPGGFDECPGVDAPWYWKRRKETGINEAFPGLQMVKVDMDAYNKPRHPLDRRQLIFYRTLGDMPPDPNLHLCAHLYASDRNSLYILANHCDTGDLWTAMASIQHSVILHSDAAHLTFDPSEERNSPLDDHEGKWFAKEDWMSRLTGGRVVFHSRVWSSDGTHVATAMQDGMMRLTKKETPTAEEAQRIRRIESRWTPAGKL